MIALCPLCHKVKHAGLAVIRGETQLVIDQLMRVNKLHEHEAVQYLSHAFRIWEHRSQSQWKLDISHLEKFGILQNMLN